MVNICRCARFKLNHSDARITVIFCLLAFSLPGWSRALAESPTTEVKSTVDQVLKILSDPRYKGDASKEERRSLLRGTISSRFDYQEMARRSLALLRGFAGVKARK